MLVSIDMSKSFLQLQGYPAIRPELDLVEQEDQLTHEISLLDQIDPEIALGNHL